MFQITDLVNNEENRSFSPCIPFFYGIECCTKGHSYGPRIRDYILIHFVLSGKGIVDVDDTEYNLTLFLLIQNAGISPTSRNHGSIAGRHFMLHQTSYR